MTATAYYWQRHSPATKGFATLGEAIEFLSSSEAYETLSAKKIVVGDVTLEGDELNALLWASEKERAAKTRCPS